MRARYDIFLSYSHVDRQLADAFIAGARERGLTVWYDQDLSGGQQWRDEIVDALSESSIFMILFSSASNRSVHLIREIAIADRFDKPVIPIRIEKVEPTRAYLYELATRHWLDVYDNPAAGFDAELDRIAKRVGADQGRSSDATSNPTNLLRAVPDVAAPPDPEKTAGELSSTWRITRALPFRRSEALILAVILVVNSIWSVSQTSGSGHSAFVGCLLAILISLMILIARNSRSNTPAVSWLTFIGYATLCLSIIPFAVLPDWLGSHLGTPIGPLASGLLLLAPVIAAIASILEFSVRTIRLRTVFHSRITGR